METNTYRPLTADEIQEAMRASIEGCPRCDGWIKWESVPDWYDGDVYGQCETDGCYADLVSGRFGIEVLSHE